MVDGRGLFSLGDWSLEECEAAASAYSALPKVGGEGKPRAFVWRPARVGRSRNPAFHFSVVKDLIWPLKVWYASEASRRK